MLTEQEANLIKDEVNKLTGKVYDLTGQAPPQLPELAKALHKLCEIARGEG